LGLEGRVLIEYLLTVVDKGDQVREEGRVQLNLVVETEVLLGLDHGIGEGHVQEDHCLLLRVGLCLDYYLDWERIQKGHCSLDHQIGMRVGGWELQVLSGEVHRETL
jgi:hypothetical protein